MRPFFSVVIPVYNRAHTLGTAVRSVLAQSEQDFEIIVVDDGSSDSPENVVRALCDPRILCICQDNRGGSAARNAGIDRASGRFVAFLDSDDRFLPHHLAAMRRLLEQSADTVGYAPVVVDRGEGRSFVMPPRALGDAEHMASYLLCDRGFVPTITLVVPWQWARRIRYDEALLFAQDTDFAIRLFLAGCRFAMAAEPAAVWNDVGDCERVLSGRMNRHVGAWLEDIRARIPQKSYYGARGWMVAKGLAPKNNFGALCYYVAAVIRGCYRPRLAAIILMQIFTPDRIYRELADRVIEWRRGRIWSSGECAADPSAQ